MKDQVGECSMTGETKILSCGHGTYRIYGSFHDDVDNCTFFHMREDDLQEPMNQGGFLEALSTYSSNQEEQLVTLQGDD
jgi:hypothetical protein